MAGGTGTATRSGLEQEGSSLGMFGTLASEITSPYNRLESFLYDVVVGRAVADSVESMWSDVVAAIPEGGDVLDVGCGGGQVAVALAAERTDLHLSGVDLSPQQVSRARRRGARFGDRVRFVEGSAVDLPFVDESFDLVLSMASIKHWPDRPAGLRECLRVLRRGGEIVVVEADRGCRLEDAEAFVRRFRQLPFTWPVSLVVFRTWVAGRALDLDEARELSVGLDLDDVSVQRTEGFPGLMIRGRRS